MKIILPLNLESGFGDSELLFSELTALHTIQKDVPDKHLKCFDLCKCLRHVGASSCVSLIFNDFRVPQGNPLRTHYLGVFKNSVTLLKLLD